MFRTIKEQIDTVFHKDPAAKSVVEILLCYSWLNAVLFHRMAHPLYKVAEARISKHGSYLQSLVSCLDASAYRKSER